MSIEQKKWFVAIGSQDRNKWEMQNEWMNEFVFAPSYRDLLRGCCVSIICLLVQFSFTSAAETSESEGQIADSQWQRVPDGRAGSEWGNWFSWKDTVKLISVWVCVSVVSTGCICHEYDRWTGDGNIGGGWQTSDLGLFWHELCRYRVLARVRVGVEKCRHVYGVWVTFMSTGYIITNTTCALATEWRLWYQLATSPVDVCIGVCVHLLGINYCYDCVG